MSCTHCPFNDTYEAIQAQNWGCLPSPYEVKQQMDATGKNWACHETKKLCQGLVRDYELCYGEKLDLTAELLLVEGVHY